MRRARLTIRESVEQQTGDENSIFGNLAGPS